MRLRVTVMRTATVFCVCLLAGSALAFGLQRSDHAPRKSPEQLIEIAADYIAANDRQVQVETYRPGFVNLSGFPAVRYGSGKDLIRRNPGCCHLGTEPTDQDVPPTCQGRGGTIVTIKYNQNYISGGKQRQKPVIRFVGVTRSGMPCRTY